MVSILAGLAAIFSFVAAVLAGLAFLFAHGWRATQRTLSPEQIGLALRSETDRMRQFGEEQAKGLREELGLRIDSGIRAISENTLGIGQKLDHEIARMGQEAQQNREGLRQSIEGALGQYGTHQKERLETVAAALTAIREASVAAARDLREEVINTLNKLGEDLRTNAQQLAEQQRLALENVGQRLNEMGQASERGQEKLREGVSEALATLRRENEQKLEQMRQTVDEKLQGTLEKRLGESFLVVSQQLRQVHEGLGDMQKLAAGVGDLKRVLTNVKSRGTLGEGFCGALLEDMLAPDQFLRNVEVKEGSGQIVEFCVKIPLLDSNRDHVLLPIDVKFPTEDYERLIAASDSGDTAAVEQAAQRLETRFRASARDISTKYIVPPRTTEYAVMYVPSEGLYAELMKRPGVHSTITREFNVVAAGPSNLMAILNAVHAVYHSVTIERKAGEIGALLLKVQSEFVKYADAIRVAKQRAASTVKAIEKLDTRQRVMGRELKDVRALDGVAPADRLPPPVLDLEADDALEGADDDIERDAEEV